VSQKGTIRRLAGAMAGCLVAAGAMAGCTSVRSDLGPADSSCYLALPAATTAAGGHGRLLGVDLLTLRELRQRERQLFAALNVGVASSQRVCVVAFAGKFDKTSVAHPLGQSSGPLAVVVLDTPSNHLLGTVIYSQLPYHFGHTHIG
jgi:hypothetical protein